MKKIISLTPSFLLEFEGLSHLQESVARIAEPTNQYGRLAQNFDIKQQRAFEASRTLCHSYWSHVSLAGESAGEFVSKCDERDVAVNIQPTSGTPRHIANGAVGALAGGRAS